MAYGMDFNEWIGTISNCMRKFDSPEIDLFLLARMIESAERALTGKRVTERCRRYFEGLIERCAKATPHLKIRSIDAPWAG